MPTAYAYRLGLHEPTPRAWAYKCHACRLGLKPRLTGAYAYSLRLKPGLTGAYACLPSGPTSLKPLQLIWLPDYA